MSVIKHYSEIEPQAVAMDGASNASKRLLIGTGDGVPLFSMRMFEIGAEGNSPVHHHDFEHEIYVLDGTGKLILDKGEYNLTPGTAVYIPAVEKHQLVNTGRDSLRFLCMVPKEFE